MAQKSAAQGLRLGEGKVCWSGDGRRSRCMMTDDGGSCNVVYGCVHVACGCDHGGIEDFRF
ncbi:hypothetical protein BS78_10G098200 [Paspalum vaginatum]|nr:hypothetical protein BS78_10G098200 [Paspalum vaginatum]